MASLENRNGSWRIIFCYKGERRYFTVGEISVAEASVYKASTEELLRLVNRNLLSVPRGCSIEDFMFHKGKPPEAPAEEPLPRREEVTLGGLRDRYLATHKSSLEPNTISTIELHFKHIGNVLEDSLPLSTLSLSDLQKYVQSREGKVQAGTIKMEVISLRTAWNWGVQFGLVEGRFPNRGLRYPKSKEKPPFMTWQEVERRIAQGGDADKLWECLYLTPPEVAEMLEHVKARPCQPWVYPMAVMAAHTGARRSEMIRARAEDVDFEDNVVTIREKKRRKGTDSTRRVPMSSLLKEALREYLKVRPACPLLFCQGGIVARSKKRSATTGHKGEETRSTSEKERKVGVRTREAPPASGVTKNEAHNHLKRALSDGKWKVLRGWHVLRHSFISALASKGIDQRFIDEFVGHTTEEMRRRYRHLWPTAQQEAIRAVFG